MSYYEILCGCCGSELCDQDESVENEQGDLICECCIFCMLADGLLYLADIEPAQAEHKRAA